MNSFANSTEETVTVISDNDNYRITQEIKGNVKTIATYNKLDSSVDYDMRIYKDAGTLIAGGYNGVGQNESFVAYLQSGHYYVKKYSFSDSSSYTTYQMIAY